MSVVVAGLGGDDLDLGNEELCAAEQLHQRHISDEQMRKFEEIIKNALTAEGIRCGLSGKTQGGFGGIFAVEVFVRAWDEERAKQVIAEHTHPKEPVVA